MLREENYFGSDKEKNDVDWFVRINSDQTILELFEAYLKDLSSKWFCTWPSKLTDMYIEMYQILQKHGIISSHVKLNHISEASNGMNGESVKILEEKLNVVILYGELLLNQYFESTEEAKPLGKWIY